MIDRHKADVGKVAISLSIVHAVTDDEEVRDGKSYVVGLDLLNAS
jgi:hypothetical protein